MTANDSQAEGTAHCVFRFAMQKRFQMCSKPDLATVKRPELEASCLLVRSSDSACPKEQLLAAGDRWQVQAVQEAGSHGRRAKAAATLSKSRVHCKVAIASSSDHTPASRCIAPIMPAESGPQSQGSFAPGQACSCAFL